MISTNNALKVIGFASKSLLYHFQAVVLDQVDFEPFKSHFD